MANIAPVDNQNRTPAIIKKLLSNINYKKRFNELLGNNASGFMSSIINLVNSDMDLAKCDANSIIASAVIAATLKLPIDKNLGFAWIVPYKGKAQFQLGYKGFVQLALRTGQYRHINVIEIYEGQLKSFNPLTEEIELDFSAKESNKVIGYAAYFKLNNGFEKTVYWPIERVKAHAQRFSKSYHSGPWQTDFDEMAKKTVLKNTLSKWGILSIEMQEAIKSDQAVIRQNENGVAYEYVDSPYYRDKQQTYSEDEVVEVEFDEIKDEVEDDSDEAADNATP